MGTITHQHHADWIPYKIIYLSWLEADSLFIDTTSHIDGQRYSRSLFFFFFLKKKKLVYLTKRKPNVYAMVIHNMPQQVIWLLLWVLMRNSCSATRPIRLGLGKDVRQFLHMWFSICAQSASVGICHDHIGVAHEI